jgi:hypothetical protein
VETIGSRERPAETVSAGTAPGTPVWLREELVRFIPEERVLHRPIDLIAFASDASFYRLIPKAVVLASTTGEIKELFRYSRKRNIPLVFRAAGTSLSGQSITDGILVEVKRHWKSIRVEEGGKKVRVEPGAIGNHVNAILRPYRAKIGPDPASIHACAMGGILSNNSSGMCCGVLYNSYHTLDSLTFVLPSGTMIDTAHPDADRVFREEESELAETLLELKRKVEANEALASRIRAKYKMKNTNGYALNAFIGFERPVDIFSHLLIGSEGTLAFYPKRAKIAQVDIRPEHLGRRCRLDLGLVGDVKQVLQALLPLLQPKSDRSHLDECLKHYRKTRRTLESHVKGIEGHRPIHPEYLTAVISELADEDAVFAADNGMCTVWAARYLQMTKDRRLLGSFVHGSMANALPQAIGAKLLYPNRQVVSLSGDGGFAMLMGDFITLSQYELPVKTVVYNNGALGMVKLEMEVDGLPDYGTDLKNPNFAKMAEAMGVTGIRVEDPTEVRPAIERMLRHDGPVLVDVVTNPSELSMPPKVSAKQAGGFALYMLKETLSGHGDDMVQMIESNLLR